MRGEQPQSWFLIVMGLVVFLLTIGGGLAIIFCGIFRHNPGWILDLGGFSLLAGILSFLMYLDFYYSHQRLLLGKQGDEHTGISGYRRSILAVGLILLFAWVLFRLTLFSLNKVSVEVIQSTLQNATGVLSGLLASLAGFYFGGKAARETRGKEEGK